MILQRSSFLSQQTLEFKKKYFAWRNEEVHIQLIYLVLASDLGSIVTFTQIKSSLYQYYSRTLYPNIIQILCFQKLWNNFRIYNISVYVTNPTGAVNLLSTSDKCPSAGPCIYLPPKGCTHPRSGPDTNLQIEVEGRQPTDCL